MKSLQVKLIALIISCIVLCATLIGGISVYAAIEVSDEDSAQILTLLCRERAARLDSNFAYVEQSVNSLSEDVLAHVESAARLEADPAYVDEISAHMEPILKNAAEHTLGAMSIYLRFDPQMTYPTSGLFLTKVTSDGTYRNEIPTDLSLYEKDDTERVGWYYQPVEQGSPVWMAPYLNENINVFMISYVVPLYKEGCCIGVLGMDIDCTMLEEYVKEVQVYETGHAFFVDGDGEFHYHPQHGTDQWMSDIPEELLPVQDIILGEDQSDGLFSYVWDGQHMSMTFEPLKSGMVLVITAPQEEINAGRNLLLMNILLTTLVITVFSVFVTVLVTRRIVQPLRRLSKAAYHIALGDYLNVEIPHVDSEDEIGVLSAALQEAVIHLQWHVANLSNKSYRDALTGVKNRAAWQEDEASWNEKIASQCPPFGVIVFDINGLKKVNDTLGHEMGDQLIKNACILICKTYSHSPVYRIGGDEFSVILSDADLENRDALREELSQAILTQELEPRVSVAYGLSLYEEGKDTSFADVFHRADVAMYENKALMKQQRTD